MAKGNKSRLGVNSDILKSLSEDRPFISKKEENKSEVKKNNGEENIKDKEKKVKNKEPEIKTDDSTIENIVLKKAGIPFKIFDKGSKKPLYISSENHSKLVDISKMTGDNISDIGDSIIAFFFEQNKENIKSIIKQNMNKRWN